MYTAWHRAGTDVLKQQRLDVGVGIVDRHADHGRALVTLGPGPKDSGIDGMASHQLLGLGRERLGLGFEGGRLGLGQQRPHPCEHRVVDDGRGTRGSGGLAGRGQHGR